MLVPAIAMMSMAAAFCLTACEMTGWRKGTWIFKPLASILFVALAIAAGALPGGEVSAGVYGMLVLIALLLSLAGDMLLIPRGSEALFKTGIFVFLAGHVAYIAAFAAAGLGLPGMVAGALIMAIAAFSYWRYISARLAPDFRAPVGAYTGVISVMVITAFGAASSVSPGWLLPVAALMFAVSDMTVGQDRFVKSVPLNHLVITPLYYGAQVMFAGSI